MELNHGATKSYFSISQYGAFSFQWKIYNFSSLRPNISISSPKFYYKDNSHPWLLKLYTTHLSTTCFLTLDLYSNSNDDIGFKFTITVSQNQEIHYADRRTLFSSSKLQPVNLLPNVKLPISFLNDVLNINCDIEVTGLEDESHTKTVTSISPNLNSLESQSREQSSSSQIHNNSGEADRKKQGTNSLLRRKKVDNSSMKIANSVPERTQSSRTKNTPNDSFDFETLKQLSIDFKRMLTQAMNTDVTIRVEDITIKTHKTILCARSPVFSRMFEHSTLEAANNEIEVTDIQAFVMKKLINYLYCGEKGRLQYEEACELYYAADKYEILYLREACMKDLISLLDVYNACPMLSLAYRHSDDAFKEQIMNFISKNFNSIVNTGSWIELTEKDTKLAALLMRYCAGVITK